METNKALPKNEENHNKPVQEGLPSSKQRPMGDEEDIKKREDYIKENADEAEEASSASTGKDK